MGALATAIHITSACVACLSLAMLSLIAHSVSLKDQLDYAAPADLKSTGMSFLFWPACGGIVDCCLFLFLWIKTSFQESKSKRKKDYHNALLFVATFFFLRPFVVFIYTFVEHNVEEWACLLSNRSSNGVAQSLCRELRAARFLSIPLFVLGVVFLSLVVRLRFGTLEGESFVDGEREVSTRWSSATCDVPSERIVLIRSDRRESVLSSKHPEMPIKHVLNVAEEAEEGWANSSAPFRPARSQVCLNKNGESVGNGLFANVDFEPGQLLASIRRPIVGSLDSERLHDTCANCYTWTEGASTGVRTYACTRERQLRIVDQQQACQKAAWNRGHKYQCKIFKKLGDREIPKAVLACMDLLTMKKHDIIPAQAWEMLLSLPPHIDDFKTNGNYGNIELMAMGASQFSLTQDLFDKDFVAAMYARVLTNSLTLITPTLDPLGIIIDPMLGHFNHSCDPNAYIIMDGAEVNVRSLKPIKKDEEIFISYIDTTNPYSRRQYELKQRWFFTCKCIKCQKGATLDEDKWAIDPKDLPQEMQQIAEMMTENESFASNPANYVGDSKAEKYIATIQGKAFAEYEAAQRAPPEQANEIVVNGMRLCHQSGLWPVYRQPYAALRDELIVNLLSMATYPVAWAQCAKRYKHIQPKLYPVPFHPVRVVQTWQMAMLAAYFAGEEEGIGAPGANMGLIAMMLTKQVLDAAALSHGPNSSFTKSVQSKADEMSEELKRSIGQNPDRGVINQELESQKSILMEMGDWIQY
ncbi:MYND finger [Stagonosporopsis vannaccii]|nr:MYND finger [Stagonosporopsis vannaccii]